MPLPRFAALTCVALLAAPPGCYERAPYHGPLAGLLDSLTSGGVPDRCWPGPPSGAWPAHHMCRVSPGTSIIYLVGRWGRILAIEVARPEPSDPTASLASARTLFQREFGSPTFVGSNNFGLPRAEWHVAGICHALSQVRSDTVVWHLEEHSLDEMNQSCAASVPQRRAN